MLAPDTMIRNRYRVVRVAEDNAVGGTLYEAVDTEKDQTVTLKVWTEPDATRRESLAQAARTRAEMFHPAMPEVTDYFTEGDDVIVVSKWIPGQTMAERLVVQGTSFTPAQVVLWADQLLDAMTMLHRRNPTLVHGEISAENLKETRQGYLSLLDVELYPFTNDAKAPTAHDDVYAMCAVLYQLLTGIRPPTLKERESGANLLAADVVNPRVPTQLGTLLAQGLSSDASERFGSTFALQTALRSLRDRLDAPTELTIPTATDAAGTPSPALPPAPSLAQKLQNRTPPPMPAVSSTSLASIYEDNDNNPPLLPPADDMGVLATLDAPVTAESEAASLMDLPPETPLGGPLPVSTSPFADMGVSATVLPSMSDMPEPQEVPETPMSDTPPPFEQSVPPPPPPPFGSATTEGNTTQAAPPPPPANKNRIWMGLGIGCVVALLCVCCGLIALVASAGNDIFSQFESGDFNTDTDSSTDTDTDSNNPFPPIDGSDDNGSTDGETVSVFDLAQGDCFLEPGSSDTVSDLTLVDCDAPHDGEAYAFIDYPAGDNEDFPAGSELDDFADNSCNEEFASYVGVDYQDSILYFYSLQPTERSWADGDREIVCVIVSGDETQLEGSMQGVER